MKSESKAEWLSVPEWLQAIDRWVIWKSRDGKKVPLSSRSGRACNVTQPESWCSFDEAVSAVARVRADGIGIVLVGDGLVAVDLDYCIFESGQINLVAQQIVDDLGGGYVEISPSGRGLHIVGYSDGAAHLGIKTEMAGLSVELYADKRYITVTGNTFKQGRPVSSCPPEIPGYRELLVRLGGSRLQRSSTQIAGRLTQETQELQEPQENQVSQEKQKLKEKKASDLAAVDLSDGLPSKCVVTGSGQRHRACFELARWLQSIAPDATVTDCKPVVRRWFEMFSDAMRTKEFAETWADFCNGWGRVEVPYGQLLEQVVNDPPPLPGWMADHDLGAKGEVLLRVCVGLAKRAPEGIFFLSGRALAPYLSITPTTVYTMLGAVVELGYLVRITQGRRHKASEYKIGGTGIRTDEEDDRDVSVAEIGLHRLEHLHFASQVDCGRGL